MRNILIALALSALGTGVAAASDRSDVLALVHQMQVAFNKGGDMKEWLAGCADETSIIDPIPPYEWHGAGACSKWLSDYKAFEKASGGTDEVITFGTARLIEITADHAYVLLPLTSTYKMNGKPMKERGATLTAALQKGPSGWRVIGWSVAAGPVAPVNAKSAE